MIVRDFVHQYFSHMYNVWTYNFAMRLLLPVYSGKQMVSGDFLIFSSNRSFLLRKRIIDVSVNHLLLQIESNSFRDSCMRFCKTQINIQWHYIPVIRKFIKQLPRLLHSNTAINVKSNYIKILNELNMIGLFQMKMIALFQAKW